MLKDLQLRDNYSSDDSSILEDLFRPCLRQSEVYYRSVGYLDSKVLAHLGHEFERLSIRGHSARLLIGQTVSIADYLAIKQGRKNPTQFLDIPDLDALWQETQADDTKQRGLLVLSWLVARRTLAIRYSIRPKGIHHDKFAYFRDAAGNEIVAHGTNNETEAANLPEFNYESLSVFRSWEHDIFKRHGEYKLTEFLRLWEGDSSSALAVEAPHPLLEKLAYLSEQHASRKQFATLFEQLKLLADKHRRLPRIPIFWGQQRYSLFDHQAEAINAYIDNDYRGIFALATGSGKTITAIHAATQLARAIALENSVPVFVVVAVPYQVLADQWVENFRVFGYEPIRAYESLQRWHTSFAHAINELTFEPASSVTSIVVVNRTLASGPFQDLLSQIPSPQLIFIGDECHRLGSALRDRKCPRADYRIGLSATPWAPHEEELRALLLAYFGKTVAHYSLADAFSDNVLVPYRYVLIRVSLDGEEGDTYAEHTLQIKKLMAIKLNGGTISEDKLNFHLSQRAAVIGSASQKFDMLPGVLRDVKTRMGLQYLLVYCGSGSTYDDEVATGTARDIERAQLISAQSMQLQSARVTAAESPPIRQSILGAFRSGSLDAVFAIKVLDEGFDMPGVRGAILLASSTNERQFIQRRGRVLRKSDRKDQALIFDFLVSGQGVMPDQFASELARAELRRCIEFSRLSLDWDGQQLELESYAARFNIDFKELYDEVIQNRYESNDVE